MRISDWSSDVCSSDLRAAALSRDAAPVQVKSPVAGDGLRFSRDGGQQAGLVTPWKHGGQAEHTAPFARGRPSPTVQRRRSAIAVVPASSRGLRNPPENRDRKSVV